MSSDNRTPPATVVTSSPGTGHVSTADLVGELEDGTTEAAVERIGGDVLLSLELAAGESHTGAAAHLTPEQAQALADRLTAAADAVGQADQPDQ